MQPLEFFLYESRQKAVQKHAGAITGIWYHTHTHTYTHTHTHTHTHRCENGKACPWVAETTRDVPLRLCSSIYCEIVNHERIYRDQEARARLTWDTFVTLKMRLVGHFKLVWCADSFQCPYVSAVSRDALHPLFTTAETARATRDKTREAVGKLVSDDHLQCRYYDCQIFWEWVSGILEQHDKRQNFQFHHLVHQCRLVRIPAETIGYQLSRRVYPTRNEHRFCTCFKESFALVPDSARRELGGRIHELANNGVQCLTRLHYIGYRCECLKCIARESALKTPIAVPPADVPKQASKARPVTPGVDQNWRPAGGWILFQNNKSHFAASLEAEIYASAANIEPGTQAGKTVAVTAEDIRAASLATGTDINAPMGMGYVDAVDARAATKERDLPLQGMEIYRIIQEVCGSQHVPSVDTLKPHHMQRTPSDLIRSIAERVENARDATMEWLNTEFGPRCHSMFGWSPYPAPSLVAGLIWPRRYTMSPDKKAACVYAHPTNAPDLATNALEVWWNFALAMARRYRSMGADSTQARSKTAAAPTASTQQKSEKKTKQMSEVDRKIFELQILEDEAEADRLCRSRGRPGHYIAIYTALIRTLKMSMTHIRTVAVTAYMAFAMTGSLPPIMFFLTPMTAKRVERVRHTAYSSLDNKVAKYSKNAAKLQEKVQQAQIDLENTKQAAREAFLKDPFGDPDQYKAVVSRKEKVADLTELQRAQEELAEAARASLRTRLFSDRDVTTTSEHLEIKRDVLECHYTSYLAAIETHRARATEESFQDWLDMCSSSSNGRLPTHAFTVAYSGNGLTAAAIRASAGAPCGMLPRLVRFLPTPVLQEVLGVGSRDLTDKTQSYIPTVNCQYKHDRDLVYVLGTPVMRVTAIARGIMDRLRGYFEAEFIHLNRRMRLEALTPAQRLTNEIRCNVATASVHLIEGQTRRLLQKASDVVTKTPRVLEYLTAKRSRFSRMEIGAACLLAVLTDPSYTLNDEFQFVWEPSLYESVMGTRYATYTSMCSKFRTWIGVTASTCPWADSSRLVHLYRELSHPKHDLGVQTRAQFEESKRQAAILERISRRTAEAYTPTRASGLEGATKEPSVTRPRNHPGKRSVPPESSKSLIKFSIDELLVICPPATRGVHGARDLVYSDVRCVTDAYVLGATSDTKAATRACNIGLYRCATKLARALSSALDSKLSPSGVLLHELGSPDARDRATAEILRMANELLDLEDPSLQRPFPVTRTTLDQDILDASVYYSTRGRVDTQATKKPRVETVGKEKGPV